ncbi:response regulator transcription factor [Peribacillus alkalitolerans]|uniref:response regulator transcription factor n=1 Tax=Peribacillus alkalitolerans TaxID=1550385 RepID=UPI0013D52F2A|nr:response regulator [Peribacillus alkalitolerans]
MYKVLLVDDEINILEGIAALVDWKSCGTHLVKKAHNGRMAFDFIIEDPPDIVISDIKMPGLNGVELIEKVNKIFPNMKFIILSGYDEFEYAKTVMQFNVKYYLLKPSNETKIEEALRKVVQELDEQLGKEQFVTSIKNKLQDVMPKAKEQFLKEIITNKKYGIPEWVYFSQLFEIKLTTENFKLVVLEIDEDHDFENIFALKEIVAELLDINNKIQLCTIIGEKIFILCENCPDPCLINRIKQVKERFWDIYNIKFTTAISSDGSINQLRRLYNEVIDCLSQRFYLGNGSIISVNDLQKEDSYFDNVQLFDHEDFIFSIRSGNIMEVKHYLELFFEQLKKEKYDVNVVKSHCLEIYMSIIRQAKKEKMDELFHKIIVFQEFTILGDYKEFIESVSVEIAQQNYDRNKESQSDIIRKLIEYVGKNFADQSLSLSKIANEVFYMNSDYLGKLFKKEYGENFSSFLIKLRVEKAIDLIENNGQVKMFEVAEEVGFGDNPRYFSQVFKKYTGFTPSEYKNNLLIS